LDLVGPTRRGAQKRILRFTLSIFVYKWLLLVTGQMRISAYEKIICIVYLIVYHWL